MVICLLAAQVVEQIGIFKGSDPFPFVILFGEVVGASV
jgi:hypothetical protein